MYILGVGIMNRIIFENGISHTLTKDEIIILRKALSDFNWAGVICSEERENELKTAHESLLSLFVDHLD